MFTKKVKCPLLKSECIRENCEFWVKIQGQHPQTGQLVDELKCTFQWLPVLILEMARQQRSTAAAVESHRNETVKLQINTNGFMGAIAEMLNHKNQLEHNPNGADADAKVSH